MTVQLAVIVPAWRQPGLLPESVDAVLRQEGAPPTATVIVDDGCPFPETARTAAALAAAHPGQVFALRQPNRGLSGARNAGIDFALAAFPELRAAYFLDADNRLHPPFLARAFAALSAAPPEIGWIYPDIDELGGDRNWSTAGPYSLLQHLADNFCDAGSLVRRAMFDLGLRFDETLRQGFEDWDFWLQAAAAGFRGRHLPDAGFLYRRRPESMLAAAERERPALLATLRRKHGQLYAPKHLLALEAEEAPRLALHTTECAGVRLLLDLATGGEVLDPPAARARRAAARAAPAEHAWPAITCCAEEAALALLARHGLLHGIAWWAERLLRDAPLVAVRILAGEEGELGAEALRAPAPPDAPILFARSGNLAPDAAKAALIRLRLPLEGRPAPASTAPARLLALQAATDAPQPPPPWRREYRQPRHTAAGAAGAAIGLGTTLPRRPARRDIAFVTPVFALAGTEKVMLNQARVLRARGWRTHLVVAGARRIALPEGMREFFDAVTLAQDLGEDRIDWHGGYFGAGVSRQAEHPHAPDALGLLAAHDVVVNVHALAAQALMAPLRRLGVRTYASLHVVDRGAWGEPRGMPAVVAGYEYAYDGVLVISEHLRAWCLGAGLPAAKLHLVRNAPGHAADPAFVAATMAERGRRAGPLRVLFLGRLDAQKGLDRVADLIARLPGVQWRVAGRPVLATAPPPVLGVAVEPPATTPAALDALYAWADVLLLPSRFEGVPLTVLEAQRLGCVPVATAVGAVDEAVTHGTDGLLVPGDLPEPALREALAAQLAALAADRALLLRLGEVGARHDRRWDTTMAAFAAHLEAA